jgi:anti-sigma factor (TIGR02949 family)
MTKDEIKLKTGVYREGSPYSAQECEDIITKLEALLDGALDPGSEQDIMDMVNGCEYCLEQYKIEKSIRKLIKTGFQNVDISKSLVQSIKEKIKQQRA